MTANTTAQGGAPPPRFDAKFIEQHRLVERYLDDKLPVKGARELENWCRANPDYLLGLKISDRARSSLKLLEASSGPLDLREPRQAWWKSPYLSMGLALIALACLIACWALFSKLTLLRSQLADAQSRVLQGSLEPPAIETVVRVYPDRVPGAEHARVSVHRSAPQLMNLHIDMSYAKAMQFRLIVDKQDQGRALILDNLVKDSNGELRLTFNTTGLAAGVYKVRIESLPAHGTSAPEGWLLLDVR